MQRPYNFQIPTPTPFPILIRITTIPKSIINDYLKQQREKINFFRPEKLPR
jgi:hypothetical protein